MSDTAESQELPAGHRIGRYAIVRKLGRGGMGVVYVARDDRLGRDVALKMIAGLRDEATVARFWREARAAASINHPNVCQLYEVDEVADGIYLAMELLQGEALDSRLGRGALAPQEAVSVATEMLAALGALHARGFVHRDVKPSNVFLTGHGAKVLDFGLARTTMAETVRLDATPRESVTAVGTILGTPKYMAPEQVRGESVDGRTDLYAVGAVLFEMLSGRPPFVGENVFDLLYATMHEQPPALQGPPAVVALDRVIRRSMLKDPAGRFADAGAMSAELHAIVLDSTISGEVIPVRALTRLIVPPIRLTKPDPELSFLSFGLAEAISGSLSTLGDVIVRAPAVAATWADEGADPRRLAASADVDLVVSGSLLRSGSQLRAAVQLIDATSGTVLGSETVKGTVDEVFELEDALTQAVSRLVSRRFGGGAPTPAPIERRDVPANARAFELFLRGSDYARDQLKIPLARDTFSEAVREDPGFAPAWAMLGRCHRFVGKFIGDREVNTRLAEEALQRALALSPNLPSAHRFLTHLESEHGRADVAIARLLDQAKVSRNDANIFAGLVHACRYAGLVDESIAAHDEARRLDPTVSTSVEYTILLTGNADHAGRLGSFDPKAPEALGAFLAADFRVESKRFKGTVRELAAQDLPVGMRRTVEALRAVTLGTREEGLDALATAVAAHDDPEALFMFALGYARVHAPDKGIPLLARVVANGFSPTEVIESDPVFAEFRSDPRFGPIVAEARARVATARMLFNRGGGPALLGLARV